ncbi:MurR/RpiR family transcriptional regulator [uncultured Corynebacterium sp.]|uniref:MurR/RpiR family transcriptional regulator n=1 Tax=uncultured Corynebacterium sp. TaxID=159447 RepID=UPI0025DEA61A|nr:MurR/RpiR family transcriptional regulator [uncultured Corynebacterium sp.]
MKLVDHIAAHLGELTPAEVRVAEFMADNPHSVGHLSALKLAEAAATSDATVVRTVRKLGFDGLDDLRESLAAELSRAGRAESSIHALAYEPESEVARHLAGTVAALTDLQDRIGDAALAAAVDVLVPATRTVVIGFGPARSIADYAVHRFRRSGVPSLALGATGRDFADDLAVLAEGDAVVVMSYDAATPEVSVLYDRAEALGVPLVQLSEGVHTVDPRCAVPLGVGRGDPGSSPGYAPTVIVLESLALAVAAAAVERSAAYGVLLDELREELA